MARDFEDRCWKDVVSPAALRVYKSFRREMRVGERPALLGVDLWRRVWRGGPLPPEDLTDDNPSACGVYAWQALEPLQRLFAMAHGHGMPVFYTTTPASARSRRAANRATYRNVEGLTYRDDDYEIKEEIAPGPDDTMIYKERASGFFGTPLVAYLTRLGVDCVIVCGESTSGCVRASVADAFSLGYHVVLAEDCVFDRYELTHKLNMFDMHHKYADVLSVDEIAAHLDRRNAAGRRA